MTITAMTPNHLLLCATQSLHLGKILIVLEPIKYDMTMTAMNKEHSGLHGHPNQ